MSGNGCYPYTASGHSQHLRSHRLAKERIAHYAYAHGRRQAPSPANSIDAYLAVGYISRAC